jgi:hypothetical protein
MLTNMPASVPPNQAGSPTKAAMGYQFVVVNDKGKFPAARRFLVAKTDPRGPS